ncbi:MAG TPA: FAD-dependent monooxygenase [Candidatus Acidoferrales bacterium]|jgi:2-polyprenyl-6-methoxyphenol hydroxylase-like FAD-dependent oxidoreductase|nr:FAD-dependent monooxygenase [Candidatus Acidoferrales bacterium]
MKGTANRVVETQVLIVGAGPVGLTLALDLGLRGVRCTLLERNTSTIQLPKMERCNARTMEIYRRLGIAERVRDAGLPRDAPMDVFLALSMADPPLVHLPCPSVAAATAKIAAQNDGGLLEPYQLISQYTLEPLLRSIVETIAGVTVRFGCELIAFTQDASSVTAVVQANDAAETIRAPYLVGCDGGSSTVRKLLGIPLQGEGNIRKLRQALFRCNDLYDRIPMGKGRHYHIAEGPLFPFIILQDSTRHWTLHAAASSDGEMAEIFKKSLAMPIPFEMLSVNEWTQHLLCAERYREGRVFIAGDAAHLVIPTGGLGMNTGVGDAIDLSWKLAATLAGWGGAQLLASYEAERRPIGLRNVKASRGAMTGRLGWRAAYHPNVRDDTAQGAATRHRMAALFDVQQRKVTEILGIEAGYRYVDSPIVWREPGDGPDPDNPCYIPTTWPGARVPHVWLDDGAALHDRLGPGYTLLRLGGTRADTASLEQSFRDMGAPLDVRDIASERARELFEYDLLLVRPDLHVVWRGNKLPQHAKKVALVAVGDAAQRKNPRVSIH